MTHNAHQGRNGARVLRRGLGWVAGIGLVVCLGSSLDPGTSWAESAAARPAEILSWRHQMLSPEEYARLASEWGAYVRTRPDDPRALVQWGNALRYCGKYDSAGVIHDRAFRTDSTDAAAIVASVTRHMINHGDEPGWQLDHARLLRARDRDPGYAPTYYMLCWTAFRSGDRELMSDCFRQMVALGDMTQPLYDLGYNILAGAAEGAIVLTNGDNDTFPPHAVQAMEGSRRDVTIVNISLLNLKWYVRAVRDAGVPIPMSDAEIEALRWSEKETVSARVQRALVEQVARDGWRRPLYYVVTVPDGNQAVPGSRKIAGLLQRVGPATESETESSGPTFDDGETKRLVDRVYRFDSMQDPAIDWNRESVLHKLALNYVEILSRLGRSLEERTPPVDGGPYLSKAIALATFHGHLDIAQAILEDWQKRKGEE